LYFILTTRRNYGKIRVHAAKKYNKGVLVVDDIVMALRKKQQQQHTEITKNGYLIAQIS
jgi:hypothetical protein